MGSKELVVGYPWVLNRLGIPEAIARDLGRGWCSYTIKLCQRAVELGVDAEVPWSSIVVALKQYLHVNSDGPERVLTDGLPKALLKQLQAYPCVLVLNSRPDKPDWDCWDGLVLLLLATSFQSNQCALDLRDALGNALLVGRHRTTARADLINQLVGLNSAKYFSVLQGQALTLKAEVEHRTQKELACLIFKLLEPDSIRKTRRGIAKPVASRRSPIRQLSIAATALEIQEILGVQYECIDPSIPAEDAEPEYIAEQITDSDEDSDAPSVRREQRLTSYGRDRLAYVSPYNDSALFDYEARGLSAALKDMLRSAVVQEQYVAGVLTLSYLLSLDFKYLFGDLGGMTLDRDTGAVRRVITGLSNMMVMQGTQAASVPSCESVNLVLPKALSLWLSKYGSANDEGGIRLEYFPDVKTFTGYSERFVRKLSGRIGSAITLTKIHQALRYQLSKGFLGTLGAYCLVGRKNESVPISAYYAALSTETLQNYYKSACHKLWEHEDELQLIAGTPIDLDPYLRLIAGLKERLRLSKSSGFWEYHNAYSDYCLTVLMLCTGHRPVIDPFGELKKFDLDAGIVEIDDKAVTEGRRYRIVPLPSVACDIVNYYKKHLKIVSEIINIKNKALKSAVLASIDNGKSEIPLFFRYEDGELKRYSEEKILSAWSPFGEYPANVGRKLITGYLISLQRPQWLLSISLGHSENKRMPFGRTNLDSYMGVCEILRADIEKLMANIGVDSIRSGIKNISYVNEVISLKSVVGDLGSVVRRKCRVKNRLKARKECDLLLQEIVSSNKPVTVVSVKQWVAQLADNLQNEKLPVIDARKRFIRRLSLEACRNDRRGVKALIVTEAKESGLWAGGDIELYRQARTARDRYLTYIKNNVKDGAWVGVGPQAMSVVSACIFGGVSSKEQLEDLIKGRIRYENIAGNNYISFDGRLRYSDWISAALVSNIDYKKLDGKSGEDLKCLCEIIGIGSFYQKILLKKLLGLSLILSKFERPGLYYGQASGYVSSQSLDENCIRRLISDKSIAVKPEDGPTIDLMNRVRIKKQDTNKPAWARSCEVMTWVRSKLSDAALQAYIKKHPKKYSLQDGVLLVSDRRKYLKAVIEKALEKYSCPVLLQMLLHWGIWLCNHPSRYGNKLKPETILNYINGIASRMRSLLDDDACLYDEQSWQEGYMQAVEGSSNSDQSEIVGRLYDFHDYLIYTGLAPDINWSEIFSMAGYYRSKSKVRANILSYSEYKSCLEVLTKEYSGEIDGNIRRFCGWMLFLGYRFGLRLEEAYKLTSKDISMSDGRIRSVCVRRLPRRDLKSSSSVRTVSFVGDLTDLESQIVESMSGVIGGSYTDNDGNRYLYDQIGADESLESRSISSLITVLMRQASGDSRLTYHSLRHSFANRIFMAIVGQIKGADLWNVLHSKVVYSLEFGNTNVSEKLSGPLALRAVSDLLGHKDVEVTINSYLHVVEFMQPSPAGYVSAPLKNNQLSYLIGKPYEALKRYRSRWNKMEGEPCWYRFGEAALLNNRVDDGADKVVKRESLIFPVNNYVKPNISLHDIHRVVVEYSLNGRSIDLASHVLQISKSSINHIISCAQKVEDNSGYDRFHLNESLPALLEKDLSNREEWKHVNEVLEAAGETDLNELQAGLAAWQYGYHSASPDSQYYFGTADQLVSILRVFSNLSLSITGYVGFSGGVEVSSEQRLIVESAGLSVNNSRFKHTRHAKTKILSSQFVAMEVLDKPVVVNTMLKINRLLFLLSVARGALLNCE